QIMGMAVDVSRSRRDLIIENAVLRHQINILRRGKKRPRLGVTDRLKLLLGASLLPAWRQAIAIVQPDTLLRWHRAGFRLFWRLRSRPRRGSPLAKETIDLIRDMARRGRLWGAERIPAVSEDLQHICVRSCATPNIIELFGIQPTTAGDAAVLTTRAISGFSG